MVCVVSGKGLTWRLTHSYREYFRSKKVAWVSKSRNNGRSFIRDQSNTPGPARRHQLMMAELHSHSTLKGPLRFVSRNDRGALVESRCKRRLCWSFVVSSKKCACYEHTWKADKSTPTHILTSTKPVNDKHVGYECRHQHARTHKHTHSQMYT